MLKAKTNDYGGFYSDVPREYGRTRFISSGSTVNGTTYGANMVREQRWQRENYTKNPVITKAGIYPWRNPSNYMRLIADYKYSPCQLNKTVPYGTKGATDSITYMGYYDITVAHVNSLWTYPVGGGGSNPSILVAESARAKTECLLKLQGDKVNIGTALAESLQSYDMLVDAYKSLGKLLLAVKHRRLPSKKDLIGSLIGKRNLKNGHESLGVANGLLQVKYGWMPLMMDLKGLYDEFVDSTAAPPIISAKRVITSDWSDSSVNSVWINRSQTMKVQNTCEIWARLTAEFMAQASSHGLANPLSLAWELVPYSFVVDWAMPIGNTLAAISAPAGLTFVGGYVAQRMEGSVSADRPNPSGYIGNGVRCEADYFYYSRTKLDGFPRPDVYVKSPFSTNNAASALALWRQLF